MTGCLGHTDLILYLTEVVLTYLRLLFALGIHDIDVNATCFLLGLGEEVGKWLPFVVRNDSDVRYFRLRSRSCGVDFYPYP